MQKNEGTPAGSTAPPERRFGLLIRDSQGRPIASRACRDRASAERLAYLWPLLSAGESAELLEVPGKPVGEHAA